MASRVVTQLISDLSGTEIVNGDGETIEFAYRGTNYVIDLTSDEAAEFDEAMATWLKSATQQKRTRRANTASTSSRSTGGSDAKAIRDWAREQGIDVPARGRIPAEVQAQYEVHQ